VGEESDELWVRSFLDGRVGGEKDDRNDDVGQDPGRDDLFMIGVIKIPNCHANRPTPMRSLNLRTPARLRGPRSGFPRSRLELGHWEKGYLSVVESGDRRFYTLGMARFYI
jgi:hypothetical protein